MNCMQVIHNLLLSQIKLCWICNLLLLNLCVLNLCVEFVWVVLNLQFAVVVCFTLKSHLTSKSILYIISTLKHVLHSLKKTKTNVCILYSQFKLLRLLTKVINPVVSQGHIGHDSLNCIAPRLRKSVFRSKT